MKKMLALLLAALMLLSSALAQEAHTEAAPAASTITAQGRAAVDNNLSLLSFSFEAEGDTVALAQQSMDEQLNALRDALEALGFERSSLRSLYYEMSEVNEYHYTKLTETTLLQGYRAVNHLQLEVETHQMALTVMQAVHDVSENPNYLMSFETTHDNAACTQAMLEASRHARENAQALAQASGLSLGDALCIRQSEQDGEVTVEITFAAQKAEE